MTNCHLLFIVSPIAKNSQKLNIGTINTGYPLLTISLLSSFDTMFFQEIHTVLRFVEKIVNFSFVFDKIKNFRFQILNEVTHKEQN